MEPPRPDVGSAVAAAAVTALVYFFSGSVSASIAAAIMVFMIAIPVLLAWRTYRLLANIEIEAKRIEVLYEWMLVVGKRVGVNGGIALLYLIRRPTGIQAVQIGGAPLRAEAAALVPLLYKLVWFGDPVAARRDNTSYILFPSLLAHRLSMRVSRTTNGKPVLEVRDEGDARIVYKLIRVMIESKGQRLPRTLTAYAATKAFLRLFMDGLLRVKASLLEELDKVLPAEPPWVRWRVKKQLAAETPLSA
ncbi:MAG: hypothetical protein GXO09_02600 [Crenarchaeota archaeon]|nr:hypothetical protein [Thermoproteota archaeon]